MESGMEKFVQFGPKKKQNFFFNIVMELIFSCKKHCASHGHYFKAVSFLCVN